MALLIINKHFLHVELFWVAVSFVPFINTFFPFVLGAFSFGRLFFWASVITRHFESCTIMILQLLFMI